MAIHKEKREWGREGWDAKDDCLQIVRMVSVKWVVNLNETWVM